jgi:DNA-binding transcriptional MerR regulator
MAKKITLETLAQMIAQGFEEVDKRFDENREQHQQILAILDKHGVMLINHTEILKNHTETLKNHAAILKTQTEILKDHTAILTDHTERLKRIESKLENVVYRREFDELKGELKGRIEGLENLLAVKKKKT